MKVFVFLAEGFEEIEAIIPIDIFRRAAFDVTTISISSKKEVCGAHGVTIIADRLFTETNFSENDLLFLPGGMPGTTNLDAHEGLKSLLVKQIAEKKPIAAICAAPLILGKLNLLNGLEAICYPGYENNLKGAAISKEKIVKSGLISTAKGAGVALQFALKIVEDLKGKQISDKIADAICI
ncbi:MAG: DJ-1/PfpI family protein [Paludibacter sp.]|nr:DJ-1/PfpI family protein [Paludibacter sp.]